MQLHGSSTTMISNSSKNAGTGAVDGASYMACSHCRRGRDKTVLSRRVGSAVWTSH